MTDWSITSLNTSIAGGVSCESLVATALEKARDGEGPRVFRMLRAEEAMVVACAADLLRARGAHAPPLAGLPISIKDNIDIKGEVSAAGSKALLETSSPAERDAPVIARVRAAGAAIVGRTNLSEFAFHGIGTNPHFGTPANAFDRLARRVPGGSSAGAAISVTDRMAVAALGTDTGGSVRIPAALNGLVGFKPTKRRVSTEGVVPLSTTLDCVGPLATCVADCAFLDSILSDNASVMGAPETRALRFALPEEFMLAGADQIVQRVFERCVRQLRDAGAVVDTMASGVFDASRRMAERGSLSQAEVWERFGSLIAARRDDIDPYVAQRIERGASMSAADYIANLRERAEFIRTLDALTASFNAVLAPTVPIVAPRISEVDNLENFTHTNLLLLRNPAIANLADRPSISIPCHAPGEPPVGLMLIGHTMQDERLLATAAAVERILPNSGSHWPAR
jgi:aspartyl-tRNA(Asn)/glutamyl-tRNA(Gln) amidotransferase subunit A